MSLPLPNSDETELRELIDAARRGPHRLDEVAALARHLSHSGVELTWDPALRVADLASSGGPASLATLIGPLALASAGSVVVKLGVPGRPAGAIDALGTVAGYRCRLDTHEVRAVVEAAGFAQFLADERFAPLDDKLFALRKKLDAVAIPDLAIASSLSKKVAVGVRTVVMEVRVGQFGNLGATRDAARSNAQRFCAVAAHLGMEARAFLTPTDHTPQPWIGRGETLLALASALGLRELGEPWLDEHVAECVAMAATFGPPRAPLVDVFERHLVAQGASRGAFERRVDDIARASRTIIETEHDGVLGVNLATLRDLIVNANPDRGGRFDDHVGVQLLARPGHRVVAGQPIAAVRGVAAEQAAPFRAAFTSSAAAPMHEAMEQVTA